MTHSRKGKERWELEFYFVWSDKDGTFLHKAETDAVALFVDEDDAQRTADGVGDSTLNIVRAEVDVESTILEDYIGLLERRLELARVAGDHTRTEMIRMDTRTERELESIVRKDPRIQRALRNSERREKNGSNGT